MPKNIKEQRAKFGWTDFLRLFLGALLGAGLGTYGAYYVQAATRVREQKMEVLSLAVEASNELVLELAKYDSVINELSSLGAISIETGNTSKALMNVSLLNNLKSSDVSFLNSRYLNSSRFLNLMLDTPLVVRVLPTVQEISQLYSDLDFHLSKVMDEEQKVGFRTAYYLAYFNSCQALNQILLENANYLRSGDYSEKNKRILTDRVRSIIAGYSKYKAEAGLGGGSEVPLRMIPGEGW